MTMTRLTLTRPDDWHLHLRDGEVLASVLPDTARRFARASWRRCQRAFFTNSGSRRDISTIARPCAGATYHKREHLMERHAGSLGLILPSVVSVSVVCAGALR